ncbi:hypothetical protein PsorP6_007571 [Peronosclerospora sorghi]|uniref:Uncharacterized protein n=1 Tax=Peronosclerospora sorghi TaxID=230839 RepID=A0ACC0W9U1_9STRA|nr:hypothetical protein PsorP6_007571 [Peronosclerospora sorghi]
MDAFSVVDLKTITYQETNDNGTVGVVNETQKANSVVGSPYWMVPEVIEMSGWSSASDIWSVGCTIIELLTTKPPCFVLEPMAELFRIVQEDHPPLPQRISPVMIILCN